MIVASVYTWIEEKGPGVVEKLWDFELNSDGSASIIADPVAAASKKHGDFVAREVAIFQRADAASWSDEERRHIPMSEGRAFLQAESEHYARASYYQWIWNEDPDGIPSRVLGKEGPIVE